MFMALLGSGVLLIFFAAVKILRSARWALPAPQQSGYATEKKLRQWHRGVAINKWSAILLITVGTQIPGLRVARAAIPEKAITDTGITNAVEDGLLLENGVFPSDVDVSTDHGVATLSGTVDDILAKERARKKKPRHTYDSLADL